jgi:hypothetical protein
MPVLRSGVQMPCQRWGVQMPCHRKGVQKFRLRRGTSDVQPKEGNADVLAKTVSADVLAKEESADDMTCLRRGVQRPFQRREQQMSHRRNFQKWMGVFCIDLEGKRNTGEELLCIQMCIDRRDRHFLHNGQLGRGYFLDSAR